MRRSIALLLPLSLAACSPLGACPTDVPAGTIEADVDGAAWSSTADFRMAGANLQINAEPADGWFMNFVLQRTTDGAFPGDAIDAGALPFEVDLVNGGFATLYEEGSTSFASDPVGGLLRVVGYDDDSVTACFAYTGTGAGGEVKVRHGALNATLAP